MNNNEDLSFLKVTEQSPNLEKQFEQMARTLFQEFGITNRYGKRYTLVDIEFYFLSLWHQDFFTYGRDEQQNFGVWLKHPSGMDLAFGDRDQGNYGGILLRGIREVDGKQEFRNGPLTVRNILSQMNHTVTSKTLNESIRLYRKGKTKDKLVLVSGRVGLTPKSFDEHFKRIIKSHSEDNKINTSSHQNYINRKYRFITEICPDNKFKEKERVARTSVYAGICTADDIFQHYGYKVPKL